MSYFWNVTRRLEYAIVMLLIPVLVSAQEVPYRLDLERTSASFTYFAQGASATGQIPVLGADVVLNLSQLEKSRFRVSMDATRGTAGFPFANQAMRGAEMLDAANHPQVTFASQKIVVGDGTADVTGALTIRGQTHPVTLEAKFFRQPGTEPGTFDRLAIVMVGSIDRHQWGVSGFSGLVEARMELEIQAFISRQN